MPDLNINVTANTANAQQNLSALGQTMGNEVGQNVQKVGLSFTDLKSALDLAKTAAQTAGQVFKQAFDFGLLGAQVTQTEQSFSNLVDVVDAAPDLLNQLKQASGGTIPTLKLMSTVSTLLAGAQGDVAKSLADASPRLLEIARAANKLNPTLGDTAFLYESLGTGIKRASPMILDNLGLTIKLGAANEAMAASLGKSVEELTAAEKQQALLNATLEAGNVLIQQVGGSVDSATDPFNRLQSSVENLKNSLAQGLAPALADAADGANLLLTWNQQLNDVMAQHNTEVANTSTTYADYIAEMERAAQAAGMQLVVTDELTDAEAQTMGAVIGLTEAQWSANQATQAVTTETRAWADSSYYAEQAQQAARDATQATKEAMEEAETAAKNIASAYSGVGLAAYEAEVYTTLLQVATGEMSAAQAEAKLNLADVKQALAAGTISLGEYFAAMLDGQITTEEYSALLGDQKAALDDTEAAFLANTLGAKEYAAQLNELDGRVVNVEVHTTFTSSGGGGSGTENTPVYDQRIETPPASSPAGSGPAPMGDTDWQAVFMSLTNEQRRAVQDMVGDSMYEADYARAITKVLKGDGIADAARNLGGRGGRTLPRGEPTIPNPDGMPANNPLPFGGGNLGAGGNTIIVMVDGQEVAAKIQTILGQGLRVAEMSGAGMLGR